VLRATLRRDSSGEARDLAQSDERDAELIHKEVLSAEEAALCNVRGAYCSHRRISRPIAQPIEHDLKGRSRAASQQHRAHQPGQQRPTTDVARPCRAGAPTLI